MDFNTIFFYQTLHYIYRYEDLKWNIVICRTEDLHSSSGCGTWLFIQGEWSSIKLIVRLGCQWFRISYELLLAVWKVRKNNIFIFKKVKEYVRKLPKLITSSQKAMSSMHFYRAVLLFETTKMYRLWVLFWWLILRILFLNIT